MSAAQDLENRVLEELNSTADARLQRLYDLLRIPSVSTDPAYKGDCRKAAEKLRAELSELGFAARVVDTPGQPVVLARSEPPAGAPHVLFYGHYDVQPADPLELWDGDPFEPVMLTRADGSKLIRARGAADDKAQLRTFIEACRAWKKVAGGLPCGVTIFLEGEEESGSPSMEGFLQAHGGELEADIALICDTNMWDRTTPAITMSLRGMASGEVTLRAASRDLHSGLYGGAALNPIILLAQILADLKDENGRVTLPGFYEGVAETPAELKQAWDGLGFDPEQYLADVGLKTPTGEKGRSVLEQIWARPSFDVNGIFGGYTGEGFKTVLPAEATARVSFRLVGEQDGEKVWAAFQDFVRARLPADCEAVFTKRGASPGHIVPMDNPFLQAARAALSEEWGKPTALVGSGGSIPIAGDIARHLGLHSIMAGFGLMDDAIHSPNEKYDVSSFHGGTRSWARMLGRFAAVPAAARTTPSRAAVE